MLKTVYMSKFTSDFAKRVYEEPRLVMISTVVETGFAGSWGDGSISDDPTNYNDFGEF